MASGSILGNVDEKLQCKVEWSSTSNGSQANTSKIRATVYARRTDNFETKGRSWSGYVAIGGEHTEISFSSSVAVSSSWTEMASMERTVSHNSDGTKQISIEGEVSGPSGTSLSDYTSYAHQDVWLDKIPRYATGVSISLVSKTLTSATFNWSANETCSAIKYGTSQSSLTEKSVNAKSGSFTITGLAANVTYTVYFNAKRSDSGLYLTNNVTGSVTTYNKATLTNYPTQFNIGSNVSVTYNNPGKSSKVKFRVYTYKPIKNVYDSGYLPASGGSFTWNTTSLLYQYTPNSNSLKLFFNLVTETDVETYTDSQEATANVTNSNPTFSNFTYQDTNSKTTGLTGNNQILVNGYSNVTATISTANKANPKNSATMTSYTMSIGSQSTNPVTYSESSQVQLSLPKVNSGIVIISAKDSRGNSTTVQKGNNSSLFKNYTDLVIKSVTATRSNNGVGKVVTLSYNGTFWNANFGSTTNTIKTLKYSYKLTTASSWTTGTTTLTKTISGNNWSGSININGDRGTEGFNISNAYNIRLEVSDELSTKTFDVTLTSGTPAMSIYKNNVAIGKQYDTSQGGVLQIGGKVGGDIYFNNNSSSIIWKEYGYGDKFRIIPEFGGTDDSNKLRIQGTVGGAGEDPTDFSDLMTISAKNGLVQHKDNVTIAKSSGDVGFYAKRTDTDVEVWFGVGSGGANHGVFSRKFSKWLINYDASGYVYVNGIQDNHSVANTTNTWIPVYNGNSIEHCLRSLWNSKQHTNYNNNQDNLVTLSVLSYWNGAYNDNGNSNLTYAHEGTIQCKPVNLYNNTSGATGTITLSQSAANFSFLRIYAMTSSENYRVSVDVYSPDGKTAYLLGGWQSGTNINYKSACVSISGTNITRASNGFFAIGNGDSATVNDSNVILILRVDGYK